MRPMIISYVSDEVLSAILSGSELLLDEADDEAGSDSELADTHPNSAADGPGVLDQE
ncbi:MAG: hypothetical protein ACI868_001134 [Granulosicoccus sp.]